MTRRWIAAVSAVVSALIVTTGCAPGEVVCPAIGWINELTIELDGDVSAVADVKLCIEETCAPLTTADVDAPAELELVALVRGSAGDDTWVFSTDMGMPEALSVRAYDSAGVVRADVAVRPDWTRVGGSEECGGPSVATVTIPL